jgi:quinol monooxygenase YgiN
MRQYSSLANRTNTHLPAGHKAAHELCFIVHDVMAQLLVSGRKASAFKTTIEFRDEADRLAFEKADDIFGWLEKSRRVDERATVLVTTVFPAVLGDMLHCFYEALETSRKGKLNITFMLVRKPLQESLFVLESVIADRNGFAEKLTSDPTSLWSQKAGGLEVHSTRIQKVLDVIGEGNRFDADYIARLRYDKAARDGFDGICNKAIHLFTNHRAIRTEPLNINFIFSDMESTLTQWSYLYSRLPYLLVYMHRIVEYVCAAIAPTESAYLQDMDRRISAAVLLWWDTVEPLYAEFHLRDFVLKTRDWLFEYCRKAGYRAPSRPDLVKMAETGAYPGEPQETIAERNLQFTRAAIASGSLLPHPAVGGLPALLLTMRDWLGKKFGRGLG